MSFLKGTVTRNVSSTRVFNTWFLDTIVIFVLPWQNALICCEASTASQLHHIKLQGISGVSALTFPLSLSLGWKQSPPPTLKPWYQTADGIVTTRRGRWRNASRVNAVSSKFLQLITIFVKYKMNNSEKCIEHWMIGSSLYIQIQIDLYLILPKHVRSVRVHIMTYKLKPLTLQIGTTKTTFKDSTA